MLDRTARDGVARIVNWKVDDKEVQTPALLWPDVPQYPAPEWAILRVTQKRTGQGIEIESAGTWFYPRETAGGLVLESPQPAPTTTVQVLDVSPELAVFHDAGGWSSDPSKLVPAWIDAKRKATSGRLMWAPALGTPANYALWVYLGADILDASPLMLAAMRGQVLDVEGVRTFEEAAQLYGGEWDHERALAHNLQSARQELAEIHLAIKQGRLRQLVERRIYVSASAVEVLRRFDRHHMFLAHQTPRQRTNVMPCMTQESLSAPEVEMWRDHFRHTYEPPRSADILVLLPCSARKPYRLSRSHRIFQRVLDESNIRHRIHEVMVTAPLGLVPRELEETYPARAYDVPVTGHWSRDEEAVIREQLANLLDAHEYKHIIAHVGQLTFDAMRGLLPDAHHTVLHRATSHEDMDRLKRTLATIRGDDRDDIRKLSKMRKMDDLRALLSMQFNAEVADALCAEAKTEGRWPYLRLVGREGQRGQTTPERGVISLSLPGAQILASHGMARVRIGDFWPKGSSTLFAVGVEGADDDIRIGDEVAVVFGDEVRACGVAQMSGEEMTHMKRGMAVQLRHVGGA